MSGVIAPPARRWAVSLADLSLLIACVLFIGWQPDAATDAAGGQAGGGRMMRIPVDLIFVDGDALLTPAAPARLDSVFSDMPEGTQVEIRVGTSATQSRRLDHWELAAARTAMLGRQVARRHNVQLAAPDDGTDVVITFVR